MKRTSAITLGITILGLAALGFSYYWNNLRGVGPAILPPPGNISDTLEAEKTQQNINGVALKIPGNFSISIFAKNLGGARDLEIAPGALLVSSPSTGKVLALAQKEPNGPVEVHTIIEGLNNPHGLAFSSCDDPKDCKLYIAETKGVSMYDYDNENFKAINGKKILDLPSGGRHFTRSLLFGPPGYDDKLLISVGSSCDVCNEEDTRHAKILIANRDGSDVKEFAKGLRNSVFMTLHPVTGKIWATEMGRDNLGDNLPPDEINIIEEGKNYGWPICYGKNIHDTNFDKNTYIRNPCMEPLETESHIDLPAHSAPLGLAFVPEEGWPEGYWHNLFVAYHGSWNRSTPTGYKIVRLKLDAQGNYLGQEDFISGWLSGGGALGRPVDILTQPGGTTYISDDKAGVVYKVTLNEIAR